MQATETPSPPPFVEFVEGQPLPQIYAEPQPSTPQMYVQLVNTGQITRHIEQVAMNRRLGDDGNVPDEAVAWQGGFSLGPGQVRFLPMPAFNGELSTWLHIRSRPVRPGVGGSGSVGRATETIITMENVLPATLPSEWLTPGLRDAACFAWKLKP